MSEFKFKLGQKVFIKKTPVNQGNIKARKETLDGNLYEIEGRNYPISETELELVEEISKYLPPQQKQEEVKPILIDLKHASLISGNVFKPYKLRELAKNKEFYPAVWISKRNLKIHREKWIKWLEEFSENAKKKVS